MAKKIDFTPLAIVIGIAIVLQLALIGADSRQTPDKIARNFVEDFYYLSPDMQNYVCSDLLKKGAVDNFIHRKEQEAAQRGFSTHYLRKKFTKLHLVTTASSDTSMTVHIKGTMRTCIYPPFMIVGQLFGIGRNYPVDEHIDLVRENGQWRVCGDPLGIDAKV